MQITLDVKEDNRLYLKQHVGSVELNDGEAEVCVRLPDHSPMLKVGDNWYVVPISDIVFAILDELEGIIR